MSELKLTVEKAYSYCKKHRAEHKVRLLSQCWGCVKYSKDVPEKMCFYAPPNNNACKFVNRMARKD